MKGPAISVIIPALNEERYIGIPLEALKHQTFKDFEVIVVDGKSSDRTAHVARKYGVKVIVRKSNVSRARNIGAKAANGRLLVFLDADTKPTPGFLKAYHDKIKGQVVAATGPIYPLEKTKRRVKFAYKFVTVDLVKFSIKAGFPSIVGLNFAISKHVFDAVKGFNEKFNTSEDWDLGQRAQKFGKIIYIDDAMVYTSARRAVAWGLRNYTAYTVDNIMRYYLFKSPNPDYEKVR